MMTARYPIGRIGMPEEVAEAGLANERRVSASTHRQALAAPLFLYGKVLGADLPWMSQIGRLRPMRRLPVVLTPDEVARILGFLDGEHRLFAHLLYGTGMRISEGLQLRVKDLDFACHTIIVREGKGLKDRALMLPQRVARNFTAFSKSKAPFVVPVQRQIGRVQVDTIALTRLR